jgi:HSP20 family protein
MFGTLIPRRERFFAPATDRFPGVIGRMEEEMDELFRRFADESEGWLTVPTAFVPKTDVVESDNNFEITVDLPGMKPEEVKVEMKEGALWITGKREEEKEEKGKTYHRVERRHGEFRRVMTLPGAIDGDKVAAKYDNGVLKVTVPKMEKAKAKRIEVKP